MVPGRHASTPLLISQRACTGGDSGHLAYGAWNEAEEVLADAGGAPVVELTRHAQELPIKARRVIGRVVRRVGGRNVLLPATVDEASIDRSDHVFFLAHSPWELSLLERIKSIRRRAKTVSVWLPEVWPSELADQRIEYEGYSMIDHIFVGIDEAVEQFAAIAPGSQVNVLPPAVDVMRFAPIDPFLARGIAVLGIGRRDPRQHEHILEWSRSRDALYIYDTVEGRAADWREHRTALAGLYGHASIAVCNYAKHDLPETTGGLRVLPGRLFEGLAAGVVMIGIPPDDARQQRVLGATVVEAIGTSGAELTAVLDRFLHPDEAAKHRVRNMALACRGHDWSHRWRTALDAVNISTPFGVQNRIDDLSKRADEYEQLLDGRSG